MLRAAALLPGDQLAPSPYRSLPVLWQGFTQLWSRALSPDPGLAEPQRTSRNTRGVDPGHSPPHPHHGHPLDI